MFLYIFIYVYIWSVLRIVDLVTRLQGSFSGTFAISTGQGDFTTIFHEDFTFVDEVFDVIVDLLLDEVVYVLGHTVYATIMADKPDILF